MPAAGRRALKSRRRPPMVVPEGYPIISDGVEERSGGGRSRNRGRNRGTNMVNRLPVATPSWMGTLKDGIESDWRLALSPTYIPCTLSPCKAHRQVFPFNVACSVAHPIS